jgi:hypothetical protein
MVAYAAAAALIVAQHALPRGMEHVQFNVNLAVPLTVAAGVAVDAVAAG